MQLIAIPPRGFKQPTAKYKVEATRDKVEHDLGFPHLSSTTGACLCSCRRCMSPSGCICRNCTGVGHANCQNAENILAKDIDDWQSTPLGYS